MPPTSHPFQPLPLRSPRVLVLVLGTLASTLAATVAIACDPTGPTNFTAGSSAERVTTSEWAGGEFSHLVSVGSNNYNPECNPWITANGTRLFFIASDDLAGPPRDADFQGSWDLYVSDWDAVAEDWGPGTNLGPTINTSGPERRPTTTADGDTLLFSRSGQIHLSIYDGVNWSAPSAILPGSDPCLSEDARTLYFVRNNDIWVAERLGSISAWGGAQEVPGNVNTPAFAEVRPYISRDDTMLFFSDFGGNRPNGFGGPDLWVSVWNGVDWDAPINVGAPLNTDLGACTPWLSADGTQFYTSSGAFEGGRGGEDIFVAFLDAEPVPAESSDETGEWTKAGELEGAWIIYEIAEDASGTLYAVTAPDARVYRSSDGGDFWEEATPLPSDVLIAYSVLVASDDQLYVGTYPDGTVFRSADGGDTWTALAALPDSPTAVRSLAERADGSILAGTAPEARIYRLPSGGSTWLSTGALPMMSDRVADILSTSDGKLLATGSGPVHLSTNGGATWAPRAGALWPFGLSTKQGFWQLLESSDGTVWTTGTVHAYGGAILSAPNASAAWDTTATRPSLGEVSLTSVFAVAEDDANRIRVGYAPGPDLLTSSSEDGGSSWIEDDALSGALEVLTFFTASDGTLFAGTSPSGDIYRWSETVSAVGDPGVAGADFTFLQTGANPVRSSTRFRFELGAEASVRVDIVSVGGRVVRELFSGSRIAGGHDVSWDGLDSRGQAVPEGLYFARLSVDGRTAARKVIVFRG